MDHPINSTFGERRLAFLTTSDDYAHQRHIVNKRLAKLRRNLKIHTRDTNNYNDKEKISSINQGNYDNDSRYGLVLLLLAERDLLHAQEMRLLLDVEPSRSRAKYLISKYKKALQTGHKLLEITSNEQDSFKILEILTYIGLIEGSLAISKKKYQSAIYPLSVVRCILQCLHSTKESEGNEIYYDLIDTMVDPSLKVALSQGLNLRPTDVGSISKEYASTSADISESQVYLRRGVEIIKSINPAYISPSDDPETMLIDSITWSEYTANIKSEDVAMAIMKAHSGTESIVESDPATYDLALLAYEDAIALQEEQIKRGDESEENQEQHIVLTYVKYNSCLLKIRRDMTLLTSIMNSFKTTKNLSRQGLLELIRDALKLNDNISAAIIELNELPGVANVDEIYDSLMTLGIYFEVQKLSNLSHAYLISNKYREALALIESGQQKLQDPLFKPFQIDFGGNLPTNESLTTLKTAVETQLKKLVVLSSYFSGSISTTDKEYIIDDLSKFPTKSGAELLNCIAPLGIDIKAVNVKPVLFDIAFNFIQYDSESLESENLQSSQLSDNEATVEDKKKSGFFGLFGR